MKFHKCGNELLKASPPPFFGLMPDEVLSDPATNVIKRPINPAPPFPSDHSPYTAILFVLTVLLK